MIRDLKKKILVTGGLGFIGSHLAEKLYSKKHKVTIFDNFSIGKKKIYTNYKIK